MMMSNGEQMNTTEMEKGEDAVGAAERQVGRYVYRRIEKLMDASPNTPEGDELSYLAAIAENVEEYGEEACADHPLATPPHPPLTVEEIAKLIEDTDNIGYSIELVRLVDGESTYTLTIKGEAPREFPSYADAAEVVQSERRSRQAQAILSRITEAALGARKKDGWERKTTTGPRKSWSEIDDPPSGEGWELDPDRGCDGESWERFEYHEERYWRRKPPPPPSSGKGE